MYQEKYSFFCILKISLQKISLANKKAIRKTDNIDETKYSKNDLEYFYISVA